MKKYFLFIAATLIITGLSQPAWAAGFFGPDPEKAPSVITYGFRGAGIGTILGLSAGYLALRDFEDHEDEWRDLGKAVGISAIIGTAGGLAIGFYDLSLEDPGVGSIVLRDCLYGSGLGGLVGALSGGIAAIDSEDGEDVALGASIGSLCGAALGIVIGFIEGPRIVRDYSLRQDEDQEKLFAYQPSWNFGLAMTKDQNKKWIYVPTLTHTF